MTNNNLNNIRTFTPVDTMESLYWYDMHISKAFKQNDIPFNPENTDEMYQTEGYQKFHSEFKSYLINMVSAWLQSESFQRNYTRCRVMTPDESIRFFNTLRLPVGEIIPCIQNPNYKRNEFPSSALFLPLGSIQDNGSLAHEVVEFFTKLGWNVYPIYNYADTILRFSIKKKDMEKISCSSWAYNRNGYESWER